MLFNVGAAEDVRCAVVGHVEVVEFARVDHVPQPGEIIQTQETWTEPAGGGAVAALELLELAGDVTFFTAFGDDDVGHEAERQLRADDLRVACVYRPEPQRRGFTYIDAEGERTITVIGRKLVPRADDPLPWEELDDVAGVYFCGGDPGAVRAARRANVLVATARELATLGGAGVELDALVHSATDASERFRLGELDPPPRRVVTTKGREGGDYVEGKRHGSWSAAPLPGPLADTYGAGDTFAAALAYALGVGMATDEALRLAAERAALAMTRRGVRARR